MSQMISIYIENINKCIDKIDKIVDEVSFRSSNSNIQEIKQNFDNTYSEANKLVR